MLEHMPLQLREQSLKPQQELSALSHSLLMTHFTIHHHTGDQDTQAYMIHHITDTHTPHHTDTIHHTQDTTTGEIKYTSTFEVIDDLFCSNRFDV